ncbi:unnamed protein product [Amoebophrya sp. A25]|nr:unnamed protein product [Amoebophrya sp. A25]|eukprot:GSA25T00006101001.1
MLAHNYMFKEIVKLIHKATLLRIRSKKESILSQEFGIVSVLSRTLLSRTKILKIQGNFRQPLCGRTSKMVHVFNETTKTFYQVHLKKVAQLPSSAVQKRQKKAEYVKKRPSRPPSRSSAFTPIKRRSKLCCSF